jgi:hypothetical protein
MPLWDLGEVDHKILKNRHCTWSQLKAIIVIRLLHCGCCGSNNNRRRILGAAVHIGPDLWDFCSAVKVIKRCVYRPKRVVK